MLSNEEYPVVSRSFTIFVTFTVLLTLSNYSHSRFAWFFDFLQVTVLGLLKDFLLFIILIFYENPIDEIGFQGRRDRETFLAKQRGISSSLSPSLFSPRLHKHKNIIYKYRQIPEAGNNLNP